MKIRCLGPLEVLDGDAVQPLGGRKQRLVLAHLVADATHVVPLDRLIDRVWGDEPPAAARTSVHSYISNLRKVVGADRLVSRGRGYALLVGRDELDRLAFVELAARGRRLLATEPAEAAAVLTSALDLWRDAPFADLADDPGLGGEIARLEEQRVAAIHDRVTADLARGRAAELIAELQVLTRDHQLHERFWAQLMVALYRSGRQGDALLAFDRARTLLVTELGIDPSPELADLHQQILRQDPALQLGAPVRRGHHLLERVGSGPAAVVWRATRSGGESGRSVALKAFRPRVADDPRFIRRFTSDMLAVARIEHPHVVPIHDYWREPDGAFVSMRLLSGGDLGVRLDADPAPTPAQACALLVQVAGAVAAAHRREVVHGALHPSNVLLDVDGNAFVSDFAVAGGAWADLDADPCAAPERRAGAPPTPAADVYALGALARALFADATTSALADVLARATSADPDDRHDDAAVFLAAVRSVLTERELVGVATASAADAAVPGIADGDGPDGDAPRNPYKGLRAFAECDAGDFFGRDAYVERLLARLRDDGPAARFLAVVGPSGSGKSSVVRAGLVPALRDGALAGSADWYVAHLLPGSDPFEELATALRPLVVDPPADLRELLAASDADLLATLDLVLPDDHDLLLVVDQFEELFTLVADEDVRGRFLALLAQAVTDPRSRVRVVATLRADYYDRPLAAPAIAELVRTRTEAVVPLTAAELGQAVRGPAERVGVGVDRGLVAQVVADVATEPAGLPLLQYALTEVFDRRPDGQLTTDVYGRTGGITGAIARRAEGELARLPETARAAARQLFLRLVTPGEGAGDTRRRAEVADVEALAPDAMPSVLAAFGAARLLTFDRDPETRTPTVEVAHEALLREWRRLRTWIDDARDDLRLQQRLRAAAGDWAAADRDPSFLATGARLDSFVRWRDTAGLAPTAVEGAFLDASLAVRDERAAQEAERIRRERDLERRSVRRLRLLAAVLGVAALVAGGLTVFAVTQARRAADQARVATARELAAAATANLDVDPERSILLAREAVQRTRADDGTVLPEVEGALHQAVTASRVERRVPGVGGIVDVDPQGRFFVTEGEEDSGVVDLRDTATGSTIRRWRGHDGDLNDVAFSRDAERIVATDDAGALRLWDRRTGEQVTAFVSPEGGTVWGPDISPDGALVAAAWPGEGLVRVVDVASGDVATEVAVAGPTRASFSRDGERLAITTFAPSGDDPGPLVVVDVATGEQVVTATGLEGDQFDAAWSPNGRWLATVGGQQSDVMILDGATGDLRFALAGHTGGVLDVDWADDSRTLASAGLDGTAKVWEVTAGGGRVVHSLASQDTTGGVQGVALTSDARWLLTGNVHVSVTSIWDLRDGRTSEYGVSATRSRAAREEAGPWVDLLPGNEAVSVLPSGYGLELWATEIDADAFREAGHRWGNLGLLPANLRDTLADIEMVGAGGDGRWVGAATIDGTLQIIDARRSTEVSRTEIPTGITAIAWSASAPLVAVTDGDGGQGGDGATVWVLDPQGAARVELELPGRTVTSMALSDDGALLAVTTTEVERATQTRIDVYDLASREVVRTLDGGPALAHFGPQGDRLLTPAGDGQVLLYDLDTGEVLRRLAGTAGDVVATDLGADGTRAVVAASDGTVRLWDVERGVATVTLRAEGPVAHNAVLSRDGRRVVTADDDGFARVWVLDLDDLLLIADRRVTRELTDEECRQYLHERRCGVPEAG